MNSPRLFLDPLYGECSLSDSTENLARQPVMQRLRGVRLSNIDSIGMPGIANISRYEHSLGTAILSGYVGFRKHLSSSENAILQAAALLHDSAIPPFGHLIEEAFQYVSAGVNHEERWSLIFGDSETEEIGGIGMQIFMGRQSGIDHWAQTTFGPNAETSLKEILETIKGLGRFGRSICGDLDLDNLDNVIRAAFHMGLNVDRMLPKRISELMIQTDPVTGVTFAYSAKNLLEQWLEVRRQLYGRFMLSRSDFVGKMMLIYSVIQAYKHGEFAKQDWILTDAALIDRLLRSPHKEVAEPVTSWLCDDLWPLSELVWMKGKEPTYAKIAEFSVVVSELLHRPCLAYRIKDKRSRKLSIQLEGGKSVRLGSTTNQWLLGVSSSMRKLFTTRDNTHVVEAACKFFKTEILGKGDPWGTSETTTRSLFE